MTAYSPSVVTLAIAALLVALGATHSLGAIGVDLVGRGPWIVGGLAFLALLAVVALTSPDGAATEAATDSSSGGTDESHSFWSTLPPWHYGSDAVDSGGQARGEGERTLEERRRRAEDLEGVRGRR